MPKNGKNWTDYMVSSNYTTICPSRNPKVKAHTKLGAAKSAVVNQREGWILEWKDDRWVEHSSWFLPDDLICPACGDQQTKTWEWEEVISLNDNKVYGSIRVCRNCRGIAKLPAEKAWEKLGHMIMPGYVESLHIEGN